MSITRGTVNNNNRAWSTSLLRYVDLTVDASGQLKVTGGAGGSPDGAIIDGIDPTIRATVFDYLNSNPLAVVTVDANGDPVSAGGGVQYVEGVLTTPATGTVMLARHTDGHLQPILLGETGAVPVEFSGPNIVQIRETGGQDLFFNVKDFDTGVGADFNAIWGIALPASGGPVIGGTATDPIRVNPTGTTAQPVTDNGGSLTVDGTVDRAWTLGESFDSVRAYLYDAFGVAVQQTTSAPGASDAAIKVRNIPSGTQAVSAASLPLPTGAATETTLAAVNTATGAQADAEAAGNGSIIAILKRLRTLLSGTLAVSGTFWQATQPVSGTVSISGVPQVSIFDSASVGILQTNTTPISGAYGLVTRNLPSGTQAVSGTVTVGNTGVNPVPVQVTSTLDVLSDSVQAFLYDSLGIGLVSKTAAPAAGDAGLVVRNIPSGTQAISAVSLPLPTGAATETTLALVDTDLKATQPRDVTDRAARLLGHISIDTLGQALMAASVPVTIASDQADLSLIQRRRTHEQEMLAALDLNALQSSTRSFSRVSAIDRRGSNGRGSSR